MPARSTRSRKPLSPGGPATVTVPPSRARPLPQPAQPVPASPAPSGRRRPAPARRPRSPPGRAGPGSRSLGRPAVPDHVGHALPYRPAEQLAPRGRKLGDGGRQVGRDARRVQRRPGAGQLLLAASPRGTPRRCRGRRRAPPGQPLHVGDLGRRPRRVQRQQPAGELGLDRDHGQRVAEDVVQVAGGPGAFLGDRQPGDLVLGRGQPGVVSASRVTPNMANAASTTANTTPASCCQPGTIAGSTAAARREHDHHRRCRPAAAAPSSRRRRRRPGVTSQSPPAAGIVEQARAPAGRASQAHAFGGRELRAGRGGGGASTRTRRTYATRERRPAPRGPTNLRHAGRLVEDRAERLTEVEQPDRGRAASRLSRRLSAEAAGLVMNAMSVTLIACHASRRAGSDPGGVPAESSAAPTPKTSRPEHDVDHRGHREAGAGQRAAGELARRRTPG